MKNLYALLACLAVTPVAHAEITATFVQDPATFGVGNNTYALQVTTDTDWLTGDIDIQLESSGLYLIDAGFPPGPQPTFAGLLDSGVFGRNYASPSVEAGWVATADEFTASWSTAYTDDIGTFYTGAFSFSPDANGTISGHVTAVNPDDPINPLVYNLEGWSVVNGVVTHTAEAVPEPSAVALSALALVSLVGFARRKS